MQGPELITELRVRGVTAPIVIVTEDNSPLTVLSTKIRIAWWLRRWKFAFARTLIVLGSLGASLFAVIYNLAH